MKGYKTLKHKASSIVPCFYCGASVVNADKRRGDHFPIPARLGGSRTVPCCTTCHDMKDRLNLDGWTQEWLGAVERDFQYANVRTKLFLAKVVYLAADLLNQRSGYSEELTEFKLACEALNNAERKMIGDRVRRGLNRSGKKGGRPRTPAHVEDLIWALRRNRCKPGAIKISKKVGVGVSVVQRVIRNREGNL